MKPEDMKMAYPLPPELDLAVRHRLNTLPEKKQASAFRRRLPALVLASLLLIGAVALADSQWGILQYLRNMGEPTGDIQGLETQVTKVAQQQTAFNTQVSIADAVFAGQRIALSLQYENTKPEKPVYLVVTGLTANDQPVRMETENDTPNHIWLPGIYFTEGHTKNGQFGTPQGPVSPGALPVSVSVSVFKPIKPVRQIKHSEFSLENREVFQQAYDAGFLPVIQDHIQIPEEVMTALAARHEGKDLNLEEALVELGLMARQDLLFDFTLTVPAY